MRKQDVIKCPPSNEEEQEAPEQWLEPSPQEQREGWTHRGLPAAELAPVRKTEHRHPFSHSPELGATEEELDRRSEEGLPGATGFVSPRSQATQESEQRKHRLQAARTAEHA